MNTLSKNDKKELLLDGTKISWHKERIAAWERGERIAPITIDMHSLEPVIILVVFVMQCFKKILER